MKPFQFVTTSKDSKLGRFITDLPSIDLVEEYEKLEVKEKLIIRAELAARSENRQHSSVLTVVIAAATLAIGFIGLVLGRAIPANGPGQTPFPVGDFLWLGSLVIAVLAAYVVLWIRIEKLDSRALRAKAMLELIGDK